MRKVAEKGLFLWLTFFALSLLAESGQAIIESETIVAIWLFDGDATDSSDNANDGETRGDGEWHHISATYDGETMKIYVDGALERESPRNEEPDQPGSPLAIGGQFESGSNPFSGTLDEIALFNTALDQDDIGNIMNLGLEEAIGVSAVSASGKIATTWANVKTECQCFEFVLESRLE